MCLTDKVRGSFLTVYLTQQEQEEKNPSRFF